jgi:hypothetical protein
MEREKLEKLRRKADQEKADAAKRAAAGKGDKVTYQTNDLYGLLFAEVASCSAIDDFVLDSCRRMRGLVRTDYSD